MTIKGSNEPTPSISGATNLEELLADKPPARTVDPADLLKRRTTRR